MRLSVNWLKDYIDPKLSTERLAERLTMAGLEVEAIETVGGDTVFEIEITPNRPDLLSILGLAREIGAITGRGVKYPHIKKHKIVPLKKLIHIENKKDCSRYIGTLIKDAQIKDAPRDMMDRLVSLGLKAINNAVDITNFVLMETGQPLHAFDYDKLAGGTIIVRRAKAGETIITLDGIERKLDTSILVIADAQKPVAIAGIMGGAETQITADTKNILLESAHFDMGLIRRASRALGLRSDSSYRFERNVKFHGVLTGADRAVDLLLQLTGGKLSGRGEVKAKVISPVTQIRVDLCDIESLLGLSVTTAKVKSWLSGLGFKVDAYNGKMGVMVPIDRGDIKTSADVIEEIARMIGFDRLPSKLPAIKTVNIHVDKRPREIKDKVRGVLTACGIDEIITHTMINSKSIIKCNMADVPTLKIFNPLNQDQELMRPEMLPSFLQVAVTNLNRGQKNLRLFELGKTYFKEKEKVTLGILLQGPDVFDLKGVLENVFKTINVNAVFELSALQAFDPSCGASIFVDGNNIGFLGKIDRKVLNNWDIKTQNIYFAQLHLDEILAKPSQPVKYQPISEFPAIVRDVSLSVKKEIPYKKIVEICAQQGTDVLAAVHFIEQYLGDKIQPGYKGLVFSCHYQSKSRTLREEEVSSVHERVLQALTHDLGATLR